MKDAYVIYYIFTFIAWICCGFIAGSIAERKGQSRGWYIGGFLLGVIAIIIVACLPNNQSQGGVSQDLNKITWKCPICGSTNGIDCNFCPNCGNALKKEYINNEKRWVCFRCNTENTYDANYCKFCGAKKIESELVDEKLQQYIENHGEQCQMCKNKVLEIYNVKIVDDMGIRYRKVCSNCLKKYNCEIIDEYKK